MRLGYAQRRRLKRIGFWALAAVIVIYTVFPFYWSIVTSLKTGSALFSVDLLPPDPVWENYHLIFAEQPFARNIGAMSSRIPSGNFVDFVQKYDSFIFNTLYCHGSDVF